MTGSQLSVLEKLDMGRARRRTSQKARSITLVVRLSEDNYRIADELHGVGKVAGPGKKYRD